MRCVVARYNWAPGILQGDTTAAQALAGLEYIPMLWGTKDFTEARLASLGALGQSSYLLGFNEPNFGDQVHSSNIHGVIGMTQDVAVHISQIQYY